MQGTEAPAGTERTLFLDQIRTGHINEQPDPKRWTRYITAIVRGRTIPPLLVFIAV